MVQVAVAALAIQFSSLDRSEIAATVRQHVSDVHAQARVKNFVAIIAERRAREELRRLNRTAP